MLILFIEKLWNTLKRNPQLSILFFLFSFANVLGLLYTAALPDLTKYFHVAKDQAQQTISFFLLGYALGQIVFAPLSNALGRKLAIYIGLSIAILGSVLCLISIELNLFSLLLFGRILTAFGASCGLMLTFTLVGDSFTHAQGKKILSYLICGFAAFPAIGIVLGGFITEHLSWKSCFYFMLVYSFLVMGLCVLLPETAKDRHLRHLKISRIAQSYLKQARHLLFILCALLMACAGVIIYIFSAEAPFIAINQLHLSPDLFGLYNLFPYIGLCLGGFTSAHLSHKLSSKSWILLGSCLFVISSLFMLILFEAGFVNVFTLFVIPLLTFFAVPIILANCSALALMISEDKAYASSLMNAIQIFLVFLCVASLSFFPSQKASILPMVYSISGVLMILLWILLKTLPIEEKT